MSTILDKSLDDIISTRRTKKPQGKKKVVGKGVGKVQKKQPVSFQKVAKKVAPQPKPALDLTYATKVVAQGLPRDLKQDAIKSQVGGVSHVSMNYNEKGQFRGVATIVFKSHKNAVLAVEKYNNAPIDGGKSKLKMELIVDPTRKPLAARISANLPKPVQTPQTKKKQALKEKVQQKRQQLQKKPVKQTKAKAAKPAKKTAEQLDQEMSDYFNN
ncbi:hypothetical protein C7M61_003341 [Candidozyma pseudohaemuli]|uniref:RRM domain-containing protein n=1 Tax=Candidozyma pseudohaemuli TaxID=418784 RepID=A0A2P7YNT5_9ASCO|nr:hypothetical protein C7M61_003341 [[Candida] pseudohaemulonii]PSK37634.1 hypothetical protein C7M61_003341 [[Candida] pseudohaemulonii]